MIDICRQRLATQFLTTRGPGHAPDVVRALGAVQAQDYEGAKWAIGQRAPGATDAKVERCFTEGEIVRTHVLRPTWHFVAPEDIRWMVSLTAPRVSAAMTSYNRVLELDQKVFRKSHAAIEKALRGGRHLTRPELREVLESARIGTLSGPRMGHLMMQAELDLIVCSGPRRGKAMTYALLDERVPPAPTLDREEALVTLARRYFATRGPATVHDFGWWSGLAMADARRGVALCGGDVERATVDGREHFWIQPAGRARSRTPSLHLLPNYDEYFIGLKDRSAMGRRLGSTGLVTGGSALIHHIVAVDGQIVGGWRRIGDRTGVVVRLDLLDRLARDERKQLGLEVGRFGRFLGVEARIEPREAAPRKRTS